MTQSTRWLATILILSGCGTAPPPQPDSTSSKVSPEGAATASQPDPTANPKPASMEPEDLSLTLDEYQQLGIPSLKRKWSGSDMGKAAKALAMIAKDDPSALPRYQSPKSGEVFSRMISDDNLDQIRATKIPAPLRIGFGLQFLQASSSFSKSYAKGLLENKTGPDESAELVGLNLRIAAAMSELADDMSSSIDKDDTTKLAGVEQVKSALGPVVQGAILHAAEHKAMKPESLARLLKSLDETLPSLIGAVPPSVRKETLERLRELSEKPEYAQHKPILDPILQKLAKAIEEPAAE